MLESRVNAAMALATAKCPGCLLSWAGGPGFLSNRPPFGAIQTSIPLILPRSRKYGTALGDGRRMRVSRQIPLCRKPLHRPRRGVITASASVGTLVEIVAAGTQASNSSGHVIANLAAVANVALTAVAVAATAYLSPYADGIAGRHEEKRGWVFCICLFGSGMMQLRLILHLGMYGLMFLKTEEVERM